MEAINYEFWYYFHEESKNKGFIGIQEEEQIKNNGGLI